MAEPAMVSPKPSAMPNFSVATVLIANGRKEICPPGNRAASTKPGRPIETALILESSTKHLAQ
jgi:hypothetical protein